MKKTLMGLFPECRDHTQLTEAPRIDEQVQKTLLVKMQIWELRWCIGLLAVGLIAGLAANIEGTGRSGSLDWSLQWDLRGFAEETVSTRQEFCQNLWKGSRAGR